MNIISKFRKKPGQAIVEFALIAPIFLMLVFGMIDFSRLLYHNVLIVHASKETLRLASVGEDITTVSERTREILEPITGSVIPNIVLDDNEADSSSTKITLRSETDESVNAYITPAYNNNLKIGMQIGISIRYTYKFITPVSLIFNDGVYLEANYYTRMESPPN